VVRGTPRSELKTKQRTIPALGGEERDGYLSRSSFSYSFSVRMEVSQNESGENDYEKENEAEVSEGV
jgi:hypothetical protein